MENLPQQGSIIARRFKIHEILGMGGTAAVFKCTDKKNGNILAVKRFFKDKMNPVLESRIMQEPQFHVNSPYLAEAYATFTSNKYLHLALPYLDGQDLSDILDIGKPLTEVTSVYYALCMTKAVSDLNNATRSTIVITDIKPENSRILSKNGQLVLFDLSCFEYVGQKPELSLGTVPYAAPELSKRQMLALNTDVYSIGICLFEMLIGRERFKDVSEFWDLNVSRGIHADISIIEKTYPVAWKIIYKATEPDPSKRYKNAGELLNSLTSYYYSITRYSAQTPNRHITQKPEYKVVLIYDNKGQLCLHEGTTVIGRNDLNRSMYISEKHFEIMIKDSNVSIRDMGSKCGTIVNGRPINNQWAKLRNTDVIQIANTAIQVRIAS